MAAEAGKTVDLSGAMITDPVALADWLIVAPVAVPMIAGAILLMLRKETAIHASLAAIALALVFASEVALLVRVVSEGPLVMTMGRWLPPFGISFSADVLGVSFAAVAGLIAFVCSIYAARDINTIGRRYGFYPFLLLMMAGVSGVFLTGDIFNLYVWFEVLLISSFGLLILGSEREQLDGATKYALLNLVATTLFLIATGYLYGTFGTLNMADIARKADDLRVTGPLITLAGLFLLAFGMKAAAFPVNFWLPASYHTPRIVTSALFAGLLTKVGVYALMRILVMLLPAERDILGQTIAWVAVATMIFGIVGALAQSDIRRLLGFIVVSGIGTMMAGIALASPLGLSGAVLYAVHSMFAMTGLYLVAGLIREQTGSFSLHDASGIYRDNPLLAGAALLLILAASGLPPMSGLWPKVFLVKASLDVGAWWLAASILVTGLLTTIALGRMFALVFWRNGKAGIEAKVPAEKMRLGYVAIGLIIIPVAVLGFYPEPAITLTDAAASGLLNPATYIDAVFPGADR